MKRMINIFVLMIALAIPFSSYAKSVNSERVVNQLSAPAVWQFPHSIRTIGQAINKVLSTTNLKVSTTLSPSIVGIMKQSLPDHLRALSTMNVFQAIENLTGASIFVIIPSLNEISFSYDKNSSNSDLEINTAESPLQKYLDRTNFNIRIATPLVDLGLVAKPTSKEVVAFNKLHRIFFGFNNNDHIVALAQNQKAADALAKKDIAVFYTKVGETLKQTIGRWANLAGFISYYLANKDLVIDAPSTFFGTFAAKDGALVKLIQSSSQAGVDVQAQFNTNNVLVIKDNSYSPILLGGSND